MIILYKMSALILLDEDMDQSLFGANL